MFLITKGIALQIGEIAAFQIWRKSEEEKEEVVNKNNDFTLVCFMKSMPQTHLEIGNFTSFELAQKEMENIIQKFPVNLD